MTDFEHFESSAPDAESQLWRKILYTIAFLVGVFALSGMVAGIIVGIANLFASDQKSSKSSEQMAHQESAPPPEMSGASGTPPSSGAISWPNSPKRYTVARSIGTSKLRANGSHESAYGPVGISLADYKNAITDGRRFNLPDPIGDCTLSGMTNSDLVSGLQSCFASQAQR